MIRLRQAVIVEGKYDKITLENIIDALIIPTNGFGIFKDKEKCELIRALSLRDGVIVMTDSDSAGAIIRAHLKRICSGGRVINVYIPQLAGKEKRKTSYSKQGLLGVEGMSADIITEALYRSGITDYSISEPQKKVTKTDLFSLGLSGSENSSLKRERLALNLGLPSKLSANAFLDAINAVYGYDEFMKAVEQWLQEEVRN